MTDRRKRVKPAGETPREINQDPKRLRRLRVAKGMYQAELAAAIGISAPYLCQLEYGRFSASPSVLRRLAAVLECEIKDLMPPEEDIPAKPAA